MKNNNTTVPSYSSSSSSSSSSTYSPPILQQQYMGHDWRWICSVLANKTFAPPRLPLVDTVIIERGRPTLWLYVNEEGQVVTRNVSSNNTREIYNSFTSLSLGYVRNSTQYQRACVAHYSVGLPQVIDKPTFATHITVGFLVAAAIQPYVSSQGCSRLPTNLRYEYVGNNDPLLRDPSLPKVPVYQYVENANPSPGQPSFRMVPSSLAQPPIPTDIIERMERVTQQLIYYLHRACPSERIVKLITEFSLDDNGQLWLVYCPDIRTEPNPLLTLPDPEPEGVQPTALSAISGNTGNEPRKTVTLPDGSIHYVHKVGVPEAPPVTIKDLVDFRNSPHPHPSLQSIGSLLAQCVTGTARPWNKAVNALRGSGADEFLSRMRTLEKSPALLDVIRLEEMRTVISSDMLSNDALKRIGLLGEKLGLWVLAITQAALECHGCPGYFDLPLLLKVYDEAKGSAAARAYLLQVGSIMLNQNSPNLINPNEDHSTNHPSQPSSSSNTNSSATQKPKGRPAGSGAAAVRAAAMMNNNSTTDSSNDSSSRPNSSQQPIRTTAPFTHTNPTKSSSSSTNLLANLNLPPIETSATKAYVSNPLAQPLSHKSKAKALMKDSHGHNSSSNSTTPSAEHETNIGRTRTTSSQEENLRVTPHEPLTPNFTNIPNVTKKPPHPNIPKPGTKVPYHSKGRIDYTKTEKSTIPGITENGTFRLADGVTTMSFAILGSRDHAPLNRTSLVIIPDLFDTWEYTAKLLEPLLYENSHGKDMGCHILLMNLPGQAGTSWVTAPVPSGTTETPTTWSSTGTVHDQLQHQQAEVLVNTLSTGSATHNGSGPSAIPAEVPPTPVTDLATPLNPPKLALTSIISNGIESATKGAAGLGTILAPPVSVDGVLFPDPSLPGGYFGPPLDNQGVPILPMNNTNVTGMHGLQNYSSSSSSRSSNPSPSFDSAHRSNASTFGENVHPSTAEGFTAPTKPQQTNGFTQLPAANPAVLNNEYLASAVHQLLLYVDGMRFFPTDRSSYAWDVVGIGSGGAVALTWASRYAKQFIRRPEKDLYIPRDKSGRLLASLPKGLRSVSAINGWAHVDAQLKTIMESTKAVFGAFPPDRTDLPSAFFSRFLFSDRYLSVTPREEAVALYNSTVNSITLEGRLRIVQGTLANTDVRLQLPAVPVPLLLITCTEDSLVAPANARAIASTREAWMEVDADAFMSPIVVEKPYIGLAEPSTTGWEPPVIPSLNTADGTPLSPNAAAKSPKRPTAVSLAAQLMGIAEDDMFPDESATKENGTAVADTATTLPIDTETTHPTEASSSSLSNPPTPTVPIPPEMLFFDSSLSPESVLRIAQTVAATETADTLIVRVKAGHELRQERPTTFLDFIKVLTDTGVAAMSAAHELENPDNPADPSSRGRKPGGNNGSNPPNNHPKSNGSNGKPGGGSNEKKAGGNSVYRQYGRTKTNTANADRNEAKDNDDEEEDADADNGSDAPRNFTAEGKERDLDDTLSQRSRSPPRQESKANDESSSRGTDRSPGRSVSTSPRRVRFTADEIGTVLAKYPPSYIYSRKDVHYQYGEYAPNVTEARNLYQSFPEKADNVETSLLFAFNPPPPPENEEEAKQAEEKKKQQEVSFRKEATQKAEDKLLDQQNQRRTNWEKENKGIVKQLQRENAARRAVREKEMKLIEAESNARQAIFAVKQMKFWADLQSSSSEIKIPTLPLGPLRKDNMEFGLKALRDAEEGGGETTVDLVSSISNEEYNAISDIPFAILRRQAEEAAVEAERIRREAARQLAILREGCALRIQAWVRGCLARLMFRRMRLMKFFYSRQQRAVKKIQRLVRSRRGALTEMRLRREQAMAWKYHHAAITFQRIVRGYLARLTVQAMRADKASLDIQRVWRGFRDRMIVRLLRAARAGMDFYTKTAIKIQSVWRMYLTRSDYQELKMVKLAVVQVQRWFRGYRQRREFGRLRALAALPPGKEKVDLGFRHLLEVRNVFNRSRDIVEKLQRSLYRAENELATAKLTVRKQEEKLQILDKKLEEFTKDEFELKTMIHKIGITGGGLTAYEEYVHKMEKRAAETAALLNQGKDEGTESKDNSKDSASGKTKPTKDEKNKKGTNGTKKTDPYAVPKGTVAESKGSEKLLDSKTKGKKESSLATDLLAPLGHVTTLSKANHSNGSNGNGKPTTRINGEEIRRMGIGLGCPLPGGLQAIVKGQDMRMGRSVNELEASLSSAKEEIDYEVEIAIRATYARKGKLHAEITSERDKTVAELKLWKGKMETLMTTVRDIQTALKRNNQGFSTVKEHIELLADEQRKQVQLAIPPPPPPRPTLAQIQELQNRVLQIQNVSDQYSMLADATANQVHAYMAGILPGFVGTIGMIGAAKQLNYQQLADHPMVQGEGNAKRLLGPLAPGEVLGGGIISNTRVDNHRLIQDTLEEQRAEEARVLLLEDGTIGKTDEDGDDTMNTNEPFDGTGTNRRNSKEGATFWKRTTKSSKGSGTSTATATKLRNLRNKDIFNTLGGNLNKTGKERKKKKPKRSVDELLARFDGGRSSTLSSTLDNAMDRTVVVPGSNHETRTNKLKVDPAVEPLGLAIVPIGQPVQRSTQRTAGVLTMLETVQIITAGGGVKESVVDEDNNDTNNATMDTSNYYPVPSSGGLSKRNTVNRSRRESRVSFTGTVNSSKPFSKSLPRRTSKGNNPSMEYGEDDDGNHPNNDTDDNDEFRTDEGTYQTERKLLLLQAREAARYRFPRKIRDWTTKDVRQWLVTLALPQYGDTFEAAGVDGVFLLSIPAKDIRQVLRVNDRSHLALVLHAREEVRRADERNDANLAITTNPEDYATVAGLTGISAAELASIERMKIPNVSFLLSQAATGRIRKIEDALRGGFVVDTVDSNGYTLLLAAARNGHRRVIDLLLSRGANINHQDNYGNTCLHFVTDASLRSTVDPDGSLQAYLIKRGAHTDIRNKANWKAIDGLGNDNNAAKERYNRVLNPMGTESDTIEQKFYKPEHQQYIPILQMVEKEEKKGGGGRINMEPRGNGAPNDTNGNNSTVDDGSTLLSTTPLPSIVTTKRRPNLLKNSNRSATRYTNNDNLMVSYGSTNTNNTATRIPTTVTDTTTTAPMDGSTTSSTMMDNTNSNYYPYDPNDPNAVAYYNYYYNNSSTNYDPSTATNTDSHQQYDYQQYYNYYNNTNGNTNTNGNIDYSTTYNGTGEGDPNSTGYNYEGYTYNQGYYDPNHYYINNDANTNNSGSNNSYPSTSGTTTTATTTTLLTNGIVANESIILQNPNLDIPVPTHNEDDGQNGTGNENGPFLMNLAPILTAT